MIANLRLPAALALLVWLAAGGSAWAQFDANSPWASDAEPRLEAPQRDTLPWLEDNGEQDAQGAVRAPAPSAGQATGAPASAPPDAKAAAPSPAASQSAHLHAMIGQMIMVGFRGLKPSDPGVVAVRRQIAAGEIGGVMLMGHNIRSPSQLSALTTSLRAAASASAPPLISVDQEGGYVQRLKSNEGFLYTQSAKSIRAGYTPAQAEKIYERMAGELARYGINLNFGPVVDVDVQGARNPIIGRKLRSYSPDPDTVTAYARSFIVAHHNHGVLTAAKHFPGHGSSLSDSHKGFTDISRTWSSKELKPYEALTRLAAGGPAAAVDLVMVGHLYQPQFADGDGVPASLSHRAISGWLRDRIGFKGVVITDDMEMGAIRANFPFDRAIERAVKAGNDILLYSNTAKYDPALPRHIAKVIANAVHNGRIPESRIEDAYARIMSLKQSRLATN